jgi:hypothetical protein
MLGSTLQPLDSSSLDGPEPYPNECTQVLALLGIMGANRTPRVRCETAAEAVTRNGATTELETRQCDVQSIAFSQSSRGDALVESASSPVQAERSSKALGAPLVLLS